MTEEIQRPQTIAPVTFRVIVEGVTWEQLKRIMQICPSVYAEKERDANE